MQLSTWHTPHNGTCGDAATAADADSCAVAVVRYGQTSNAGRVPNPRTFMAVTTDLGDPGSPFGDIHPRDKQQMASRHILLICRPRYTWSIERK